MPAAGAYRPRPRGGFTGNPSTDGRGEVVDARWVLSWVWLAILAVVAAQWSGLAYPLRLTLYLVVAALFLTNTDKIAEPLAKFAAGLAGR